MDEENIELPYEGEGVHIRAYQRIDTTNNHHMLDFLVYPIPEQVLGELADFLRLQTEKWLIEKKVVDQPFETVEEIPAGATLQ